MMDFIVLGLIPGTHIQITFGGFLLLAAVVLLSLAYIGVKISQHHKLGQRRHFDIISLRNLEQA